MDPTDALKLGIMWSNVVYIDVAVAFGLVHESVAFQHIGNAVTFIMADAGVKMFAYLDNYIIVSPRVSAGNL